MKLLTGVGLRTGLAVVAITALAAFVQAQTPAPGDLGRVHLSRSVRADGEPLAVGTYTVRLSQAAVPAVVGETPGGSVWVEFVQNGDVKGRELATVLTGTAVKQVAKETPPAAGSARVELLRGGAYVRVWLNHDGTQYLIHLVVG